MEGKDYHRIGCWTRYIILPVPYFGSGTERHGEDPGPRRSFAVTLIPSVATQLSISLCALLWTKISGKSPSDLRTAGCWYRVGQRMCVSRILSV